MTGLCHLIIRNPIDLFSSFKLMNIECTEALLHSLLNEHKASGNSFSKQMGHLRGMVNIRGRAVAQRRALASRGTRGPGSTPGCPLSSSFLFFIFFCS